MENPLVPAVLDDLPFLLDNPDLAEALLHRAFADLQRTNVLVLQAVVCLSEGMRLEAELRALPAPTEEERIKHAAVAAMLAGVVDSFESLSEQQRMLIRLVGLLFVVRAAASARSRAHLLPGLLLAAVSAAVVVYVSTGGAVVPGFRSFVRFALLMLGFLFASDRPRAPGRRGG
ncbi:hypothetical protein D1007_02380 [Hordeum vulgare]|uniref:Uncharacterized protein n=1 Tax=Hordeum vulgare subsp. vulgare TaxID=112509 RepID=A0A8I6XF70_HORVV|nr:hypothetical protein D1007_02380 [Hordeum vulgare]KAI4999932.1 hypothetical protein ZWY2020_004521 [Hordeum vulgare]